MKRKYADVTGWTTVVDKHFVPLAKRGEYFDGSITGLVLTKMAEPYWITLNGQAICIADDDYVWVQCFPAGRHYVMTAMMDQTGKVVYFYFDIVLRHGTGENGVPWYDDLYLDLAMIPSGAKEVWDADELEEALQNGTIGEWERDLAVLEMERLLLEVTNGTCTLPQMVLTHANEWRNIILQMKESSQ
ncbi:hypothetical protein C2W64_00468 [Brevibacillus laterosporus]|nr:DUF402 domain-containing protein [Brevibacillus laterosporus]RAP28256.1 hypothetical protein C2W64_00468 [Brevibacillus laterosporus]